MGEKVVWVRGGCIHATTSFLKGGTGRPKPGGGDFKFELIDRFKFKLLDS